MSDLLCKCCQTCCAGHVLQELLQQMVVPLQILHLTEQQEQAQQAMEQLSKETTAAREALLKALRLRSCEWQQHIATFCSCTPAAQWVPDLRVHQGVHAMLEHCTLTELPAARQPNEVLGQHVSATSLLRGRFALIPRYSRGAAKRWGGGGSGAATARCGRQPGRGTPHPAGQHSCRVRTGLTVIPTSALRRTANPLGDRPAFAGTSRHLLHCTALAEMRQAAI